MRETLIFFLNVVINGLIYIGECIELDTFKINSLSIGE